MTLFWFLFLPIVLFEMLGSYGIGAYGKFHDPKWIVLTFLSFGLTGSVLCYLASRGSTLSWLSLLVFGCITPLAGYAIGIYFFGEKFSLQALAAIVLILIAVGILSIPKS